MSRFLKILRIAVFTLRKRDSDDFLGFTRNRSRAKEKSKNDVFYYSVATSGCYIKKRHFTEQTIPKKVQKCAMGARLRRAAAGAGIYLIYSFFGSSGGTERFVQP